MNKVFPSAEAALFDFRSGLSLMSSGFGLSGNPENLITAVNAGGFRDLTIISNNCGTTERGLGVLLQARQVRKMIGSYVGENKELERQFLAGELELELCPQGTLAERIRAGGAGIPAFYTPTGVGTKVADGKEVRDFDGRAYILERALHADFAFVKAWRGDRWGNLEFRKTARNFGPAMATAATVVIAEVEELVEVGALDPDRIHTPSIYIHRIFQGTGHQKPIEQRTVRKRPAVA